MRFAFGDSIPVLVPSVGTYPRVQNRRIDQLRRDERIHNLALDAALLVGGYESQLCRRLQGCQLKPDGLPRLFLSDGGPIDCIPTRSDILDLEDDNIAATHLAID
jgi:hypothetical protein